MSLVENCGMVPVVPAVINGGTGYNNGNGNGYGADGGMWCWWLLILFLFIFNGNWGRTGNNGNGGGDTSSMLPWLLSNNSCQNSSNDVQRGFDQQAIISGINGITNAVNTGFSNAEVSRCNQQANILQTLNNIAMTQQECCCENRAATADVKYAVATEACNNRQTVNTIGQNILTSNDVNTRTIVDAVNGGTQTLMNKICQLELNAKDDKINTLTAKVNSLENGINISNQTAQILAGQQAQAIAVENNVNPRAVPAYIVQNPNGCGCQNNCGYGYYNANYGTCCG